MKVLAHAAMAALAASLLLAASATSQEKTAESSAAAALQYKDAANFQNNGAFDLAVEEWQKFLKNHAQDPLAAKAQHYLGVCQLQLKQLEPAAASFEKVLKDYPKFELRDEALLNLGSCQYTLAQGGKKELYPKAAATFQTLLTDFPKSKFTDEALYFQGEALYADGKKQESVAAYGRLVKEFDKSKRRADALYALGVAQEELGQHAEAGQTYDIYLKEFAGEKLATEVRMRKADTILEAGDFAKAESIFGEVAAIKDFNLAGYALSRQAFCLAKLNRYAEAGKLYARLAADPAGAPKLPDAELVAGRCFYLADQFAEAQPWFEKAIAKKDDGSAEAAHWLCRIWIKEGKAAEAADVSGKHLAAAKGGPFGMLLELDQADALYELPAKRAEALRLYAKFATAHPQHESAPQARYNAAYAALELKQYDEGLNQTAAFVGAYPQDKLLPDVQYVAAECNVQLQKFDAAEKLFGELAQKYAAHPDADTWRVRLGVVAYLAKKYDQAIAALTPIAGDLKSADHKAEAQYLIGASLFHKEKFAEAVPALSASLAANAKWKESDEALLLLARCDAKLGKPSDAKAKLAKLLADYPQSKALDQAHYRLGELAYAANEYPAAIAEYKTVAEKFAASPFVPFALYNTGWAQLKSKEFKEGINSFTSLITKFPQHELATDAKLGRAICRRQSGDSGGAIADIDDYLKSNPDQAHQSDARYERGLAQVAANEFAGAATTLDALLKADPKYAAADKVLYELGWALKSQEKHGEAAVAFAKIVADHADSPLAAEAAFHVGEDQYDKKDYAAAAKSYAAAKAKSSSAEIGERAVYKLGWAEFQQKKYAEALAQFSEQLTSFASGPLAADAVFMKAECLFRQENYKEAWPAYQAALKTKASSVPFDVLTRLHGGQSAAQLKQWEEAAALLAQIPAKYEQSPYVAEANYELGWAKQNLNQTAEAIAGYEAAATQSRDHVGARARFMLGELLFTQKKHDEAIKEFQRAMFGYGGEQASAETKNWQAKSGYEAGRCAEVQIAAAADAAAKQKHVADATRFYTFVAEKHAHHELAAEAKKRLAALGRL